MLDMKEQLATLFEFQQVESAISARVRALRQMDDGSAAQAKLEAAQAELAAREKHLHDREGLMLDRELRLKGAEEEAKAKSKQAYGGTVSDPKQLAALEKKIEELRRLKDRLEGEILTLMDEVEAAQKAVVEQRDLVSHLQEQATAAKERFAQQSERLKREVAELKQQRQTLWSQLDESLRSQYEAVRAKTGDTAVAAVHLGCCTACKVTLPSTYAPKLRAGDQIVKCESCRRILFLPPGESPFKPEEED